MRKYISQFIHNLVLNKHEAKRIKVNSQYKSEKEK